MKQLTNQTRNGGRVREWRKTIDVSVVVVVVVVQVGCECEKSNVHTGMYHCTITCMYV